MSDQTNPYLPAQTSRHKQRSLYWEVGRKDRLAGLPCKSANGAYLEGWYSIPAPPSIHNPPASRGEHAN